MHNLIIAFGMPFDITKNAYWIEPNKNLRRPSKVKQILKMRASNESKEKIDYLVSETTDIGLSEMAFFGEPVDAGSIMDELITERLEQLDTIRARRDSRAYDRFVTGNSAAYHGEFESYLTSADKRFNVTWLYTLIQSYGENRAKEVFPGVKPGQAMDFMDEAQKRLTPENYEHLAHISNWLVSFPEDGNTHVYCNFCLFLFLELEQEKNIEHAFTVAWVMAYSSVHFHELFGLICYRFRHLLTKERFPFLNLTFIDYFIAHLNETRPNGVTNIMHHLVFKPFVRFIDKATDLEEPFETYINIKERCETINFNAVDHTLDYIQSQMDSFLDIARTCVSEPGVKLKTATEQDFGITGHNMPQAVVFDLRSKLHHLVFAPAIKETDAYAVNIRQLSEQLESIEEKAKTISQGSPLDAIDELSALAAEKTKVQSQLKKLKDNQEAKFIELCNALKAVIDELNENHPVTINHLELDNEALQGMVADLELRTKELQQENKSLKEAAARLSCQPVTKDEATACPDFDLAFQLMESKEPVVDLVKSIIEKTELIPSDKLIKSLDAIKGFSRLSELGRYLLTLASPEFSQSYQEKGSLGAFEHFSKTTLTFKESETTMASTRLKKQREFTFAGKKILCEPHLKLGINNTEQQQLRIHFAIQDGKVYLGYIGRHLETGSF